MRSTNKGPEFADKWDRSACNKGANKMPNNPHFSRGTIPNLDNGKENRISNTLMAQRKRIKLRLLSTAEEKFLFCLPGMLKRD